MKVVTLLNEKGGVGKTTLTTHLAAGLAILGHRVVLVDADPQANATSAVGLEKRPAFYDLCVREASWQDTLSPVHPDVYSPPDRQAKGQLFACPGNNETRNVANSMRSRAVIRRRFQELKKLVDFIVVDTSPTPSLLNESILVATDYVLMPTDCESFSALEGVPDSIQHVQTAHEAILEVGLEGSRLMGIIPNKYRAKTLGHNEIIKHLHKEYGSLVWEPMAQSIVYSDAQLMQQFLYGFAPDSKATEEMWNVVKRVEKALAYEQK